jgi:hypothetical protein
MKIVKLRGLAKSTLLGIFVALMVISFTSCSKKIRLLNSTVVPSAKGFVEVKTDKNKNYTITVEVTDLAEVERVQPSKTTYVVWMETEKGNVENLGQLVSSTGFLSKQRTASLKTVSSFKPVKVFITAEEGTNVRYPDSKVVLTTDTF